MMTTWHTVPSTPNRREEENVQWGLRYDERDLSEWWLSNVVMINIQGARRKSRHVQGELGTSRARGRLGRTRTTIPGTTSTRRVCRAAWMSTSACDKICTSLSWSTLNIFTDFCLAFGVVCLFLSVSCCGWLIGFILFLADCCVLRWERQRAYPAGWTFIWFLLLVWLLLVWWDRLLSLCRTLAGYPDAF